MNNCFVDFCLNERLLGGGAAIAEVVDLNKSITKKIKGSGNLQLQVKYIRYSIDVSSQ